ncbi:unnamed protein product [Amoebophrya sp. A25]|nr:unnamed protein product [Amoebophrya sp. A25]|eukprot:GSA25T00014764001.1
MLRRPRRLLLLLSCYLSRLHIGLVACKSFLQPTEDSFGVEVEEFHHHNDQEDSSCCTSDIEESLHREEAASFMRNLQWMPPDPLPSSYPLSSRCPCTMLSPRSPMLPREQNGVYQTVSVEGPDPSPSRDSDHAELFSEGGVVVPGSSSRSQPPLFLPGAAAVEASRTRNRRTSRARRRRTASGNRGEEEDVASPSGPQEGQERFSSSGSNTPRRVRDEDHHHVEDVVPVVVDLISPCSSPEPEDQPYLYRTRREPRSKTAMSCKDLQASLSLLEKPTRHASSFTDEVLGLDGDRKLLSCVLGTTSRSASSGSGTIVEPGGPLRLSSSPLALRTSATAGTPGAAIDPDSFFMDWIFDSLPYSETSRAILDAIDFSSIIALRTGCARLANHDMIRCSIDMWQQKFRDAWLRCCWSKMYTSPRSDWWEGSEQMAHDVGQ